MAQTINKKAQCATRKNGVNKDVLVNIKPNKANLTSIRSTQKSPAKLKKLRKKK